MSDGWDDGWDQAMDAGDGLEEYLSAPIDELGDSWRSGRVARGRDGNAWGLASGRVPFEHSGRAFERGRDRDVFDDPRDGRDTKEPQASRRDTSATSQRPAKLTAAQRGTLDRLARNPRKTGLPANCEACGCPISSEGMCGCS